MTGLIEATWVGPGGYRLVDGTLLEPGVTTVLIPSGEARDSDHWHPVQAAADNPAPAAERRLAVVPSADSGDED